MAKGKLIHTGLIASAYALRVLMRPLGQWYELSKLYGPLLYLRMGLDSLIVIKCGKHASPTFIYTYL